MTIGAEISKEILEKINYPKDKIKKIVYFISVRDNWAFGDIDIYKKNQILNIFTDLDFIWMATSKGFPALMKILKKNYVEMIEYLEFRKTPMKNLPFSSQTTKKLYRKYLRNRKRMLKSSL